MPITGLHSATTYYWLVQAINFAGEMLAKGDIMLLASDMIGPHRVTPGNNIRMTLECNSEPEIRIYFAKLLLAPYEYATGRTVLGSSL